MSQFLTPLLLGLPPPSPLMFPAFISSRSPSPASLPGSGPPSPSVFPMRGLDLLHAFRHRHLKHFSRANTSSTIPRAPCPSLLPCSKSTATCRRPRNAVTNHVYFSTFPRRCVPEISFSSVNSRVGAHTRRGGSSSLLAFSSDSFASDALALALAVDAFALFDPFPGYPELSRCASFSSCLNLITSPTV